MGMWIPGLDSPHREHPFVCLNVPFALFSRSMLYTCTLRQIFERLPISGVSLGYKHPIGNWIPGLDSRYQEHSL